MRQERWRRAEELFHAALERSPEARLAFLEEACADDPELLQEIQVLVGRDEQAGSFLERPLLAGLASAPGARGSLVGRRYGPYRIMSYLGAGGMGEVYRAHDCELERDVAIKTLPPELTRDRGLLARSRREARTLASLNHPNIPTIYEIRAHEGTPFLVMELLEGETLRVRLGRSPLPLTTAIAYAQEICNGLVAAHDKGIIHRDLKPENLFITESGVVKVLDFGLAKLTRPEASGLPLAGLPIPESTEAGKILGTVGYMSPEQLRGQSADPRSDIFSFGCVLYEMLSRRSPFQRDTAAETVTAILRDDPPELASTQRNVPVALEVIVRRCLEKRAEDRFSTVHDLALALRSITGEGEAATRRAAVAVRRFPRARALAIAGLATVVAVSALVFTLTVPDRGIQTPRAPRIVVLPFENLGPPEDTYFAAGMAEEITSRLANVRGLGVISRTSAIGYDRKGKTIRQVGEDLGVDYVLEGSVRWEHGQGRESRVRITPQLIRVADDTHVWSDRYDRVVADVFAIQSEVAERTVKAMGVTLLPREQIALKTLSTNDLDAYDLYLRGRELESRGGDKPHTEETVRMYQAAADRDPRFAEAFAGLATMHLHAYWNYYDRSQERLAKARDAVERAVELRPDLAQTHVARGLYFYHGLRDYPSALKEFAAAAKIQPSNSGALLGTAAVQRRQGRWADAAEELSKIIALDPQNAGMYGELAVTCVYARRYADANRALDLAITLSPQWGWPYELKSWLQVQWRGDLDAAQGILDQAEQVDGLKGQPGYFRHDHARLSLFRRDYERALHLLQAAEVAEFNTQTEYRPLPLLQGQVQMLAGQHDIARRSFEAARLELEQKVEQNREDDRYQSSLGIAYAGLGRSEEAVGEVKLACELMPASMDAFRFLSHLEDLALVHTMTGQAGDAIATLDELLALSGWLTPHVLRLDPRWDPLRSNPQFQALLIKYEVKP